MSIPGIQDNHGPPAPQFWGDGPPAPSSNRDSWRHWMTALLLLSCFSGLKAASAIVQPYGPIKLSYERLTGSKDSQGRWRLIATGSPVLLSADIVNPNSPPSHYEIRANRLEYTLSQTSIATAAADGDVRVVASTHVAQTKDHPAGEQVLVVTGQHATFDNRAHVVDMTGSPHMELTDPTLSQPATLSDAAVIHVNVITQDFDITGDNSHRPSITLDPAPIPKSPTPAARSGG